MVPTREARRHCVQVPQTHFFRLQYVYVRSRKAGWSSGYRSRRVDILPCALERMVTARDAACFHSSIADERAHSAARARTHCVGNDRSTKPERVPTLDLLCKHWLRTQDHDGTC